MDKTLLSKLVEELGGEGEWTKGIQIELHPNTFYCKYQFWNREPKVIIRAYNDERILEELKVLLFIIRWKDKRETNYQLPNLFRKYLDKYGFVKLYNIYKEEKMMTPGIGREEIILFETEWNYLIKKIEKENNIKI